MNPLLEAHLEGSREIMRSQISEKDFQSTIVMTAKLFGWKHVYHTRDSRGSDKGFPDLVLVRYGRIIFAELKVKKQQLTIEQERWLEALQVAADVMAPYIPDGADAGVEVYEWRPEDWPQIEQTLRRPSPRNRAR